MKILRHVPLRILFSLLLLGAVSPVKVNGTESFCRPTEENIEGPYYKAGAPFREHIAPEGMEGDRFEVSGTVFARDCVTPLEGAVIEVWQTDAAGEYDFSADFLLRGRLRTDSAGRYRFETLLPGRYRSGSTYRPGHIHLRISHPGGRTLITQLYFENDPYLAKDSFVRSSLVVSLKESSRDGKALFKASFDIILDRP